MAGVIHWTDTVGTHTVSTYKIKLVWLLPPFRVDFLLLAFRVDFLICGGGW